MIPALTLAYLGDAVFELCVRTELLSRHNTNVKNLNAYAKKWVTAQEQAKMYHKIMNYLSDEEAAVMKRGRNAKTNSFSRHSSVSDYHHATGLEALFGYLHIKGEHERITQLFNICISE